MSIDSRQSKMECVIADNVTLPPNCEIGSFVKIYPNVTFGSNVTIGDFCVIGQKGPKREGDLDGLHIPDNSVIRSHSVVYAGSTFGSGLTTGHHVVIRERTVAGKNLRVGNFSDIEGDCEIGDYCRFHGYVHVGKGSRIGNFVWLFSLVTLTNDPLPPSHIQEGVTVEDGVVVCVGATLLPGAHIGRGVMVSENSSVTGKVPPAVLYTTGKSSIPITKVMNFRHKLKLPWQNHFRDAYPDDAQESLETLRSEIVSDTKKLRAAATKE